MKRLRLAIVLLGSLAIFSCKNENQDVDETEVETTTDDPILTIDEDDDTAEKIVMVRMEPKSGSNLSGTVEFVEENGEVTMRADLTGLTEGTHAIHLHETGDCSAQDATSAGGHWNPTFEPHGEWGDEGGYHRGDIGNFEANAEGNAQFDFSTDQWCIGCEDEKKNILGKAVIVHQGKDDYVSQPSGDAGTRIGCGVIQRGPNTNNTTTN